MEAPKTQGGAPSVIGGTPANPDDFPATFTFLTTGGGCTSTAVGQRVILTAAHCVDDGAMGEVQFKGKSIRITCEHHAQYVQNRTKDFALCRADEELKGIPFERISSSIAFPSIGSDIKLVGYGCRQTGGSDRSYGVLFEGSAKVTRLPIGDDLDTIVSGGGALCYGDSGGAAYYYPDDSAATRQLIGVNSRGNISDTSYLSSTATPSFIEFAVRWAKKNGLDICGLTRGAKGCRG